MLWSSALKVVPEATMLWSSALKVGPEADVGWTLAWAARRPGSRRSSEAARDAQHASAGRTRI